MVTGGRTTTKASVELPLETMVSRASGSERLRDALQFESRKVYDFLDRSCSIAEISAQFSLPMRAAIVLVSDMVAQEILAPADVVEVVDTDFLLRIRRAIQAI